MSQTGLPSHPAGTLGPGTRWDSCTSNRCARQGFPCCLSQEEQVFPSRPSHGSSEAGTLKVVRKGTQKQHLAFLKDC